MATWVDRVVNKGNATLAIIGYMWVVYVATSQTLVVILGALCAVLVATPQDRWDYTGQFTEDIHWALYGRADFSYGK